MARKKQDYESMINELENIVNEMENNELSLEQTIKYYEDGIKLSNKLYTILNEAEEKIKILQGNNEEDFDVQK